jgi:hypothetical protein
MTAVAVVVNGLMVENVVTSRDSAAILILGSR